LNGNARLATPNVRDSGGAARSITEGACLYVTMVQSQPGRGNTAIEPADATILIVTNRQYHKKWRNSTRLVK
jgi:hypothetical protein